MNQQSTFLAQHEEQLKALCALSDLNEPHDWRYLTNLITDAPDPETAVQGVLDQIPTTSETLHRKWRSVITDMWSLQHPHVPLLAELPLPTDSAEHAPILADARAYIAELQQQPVAIVEEKHEWLVEPDDAMRLAKALPSYAELPLTTLETEWNLTPLRRLRAVLQAARLARPLKGELVPVQSRIQRFNALPAKHQLFILWHADIYHVDWAEFSGLWSPYARVVQDYLPLLWEAMTGASADSVGERAAFASSIMQTYSPLWNEEGLLDLKPGHAAALHLVQQHALPTVIDRFLLQDLFERHGLVTLSDEFGSISKFAWTGIGEALLLAEHNQQLPCGNDLLNP